MQRASRGWAEAAGETGHAAAHLVGMVKAMVWWRWQLSHQVRPRLWRGSGPISAGIVERGAGNGGGGRCG